MKYLVLFIQLVLIFLVWLFMSHSILGSYTSWQILMVLFPLMVAIISTLIWLYCDSKKKNSKPWIFISVSMSVLWYLIVSFFIK